MHWYNFWTGCFTLSKGTVEYRKIFQLNFLKRNIENDAKRQYKLPDSLLHRVNELQTSTVKLTHRVKTRTNHQGHRLDTKNSWKWLLFRDVISRTRPRVEDNNKPISRPTLHLTYGTNFLHLFAFLVSRPLQSALLHRQAPTLLLNRWLACLTGSSTLVLKLTFSPDPFPRNLPLSLTDWFHGFYAARVQKSLALKTLSVRQIKPAQLAFGRTLI